MLPWDRRIKIDTSGEIILSIIKQIGQEFQESSFGIDIPSEFPASIITPYTVIVRSHVYRKKLQSSRSFDTLFLRYSKKPDLL